MDAAAEHFRLPFRSRKWQGRSGNWLGVGAGSSIDFQDHRPYLPGDDPRYIDWRAYARTGAYTMKLYREEVSPLVDLVLDVSHSMFYEPRKALRANELALFSAVSARQAGAALHCYLAEGAHLRRAEPGELAAENGMQWHATSHSSYSSHPHPPGLPSCPLAARLHARPGL
jgi:uncharacterized protein (DUF58 family)